MDRITLHSSRALVDSLNHAVAVFQDDELHITPLEGIVQIRQQFDYLDESDKQKETKNVKEGNNQIYLYVSHIQFYLC